jgi:hypothetical protein
MAEPDGTQTRREQHFAASAARFASLELCRNTFASHLFAVR